MVIHDNPIRTIQGQLGKICCPYCGKALDLNVRIDGETGKHHVFCSQGSCPSNEHGYILRYRANGWWSIQTNKERGPWWL